MDPNTLLQVPRGADGETWDTLPPFATEAHQRMFALVNKEKADLDNLKAEALENEERVAVMSEHLKNVQQELAHTQVGKWLLLYARLLSDRRPWRLSLGEGKRASSVWGIRRVWVGAAFFGC